MAQHLVQRLLHRAQRIGAQPFQRGAIVGGRALVLEVLQRAAGQPQLGHGVAEPGGERQARGLAHRAQGGERPARGQVGAEAAQRQVGGEGQGRAVAVDAAAVAAHHVGMAGGGAEAAGGERQHEAADAGAEDMADVLPQRRVEALQRQRRVRRAYRFQRPHEGAVAAQHAGGVTGGARQARRLLRLQFRLQRLQQRLQGRVGQA